MAQRLSHGRVDDSEKGLNTEYAQGWSMMPVTASSRIPVTILRVDDLSRDGEMLDIMLGEVGTKQTVVNDTTAKVFDCETYRKESARANTPAALDAAAEVPPCVKAPSDLPLSVVTFRAGQTKRRGLSKWT
jgi:hypothetical protein